MRIFEKIAVSAVAAGSVAAIAWMGVRAVTALIFLAAPMTDAAVSSGVTTAADKALAASLPIFLLDNGSVAVSDASGYIAAWDGFHAHRAGLWSAASEATLSLTAIAVLIAVLLLSIRLIRGVPFTRSLTRWVGGAGVSLLLGGGLSQLFTWLSRQEMLAAVAGVVQPNNFSAPSPAIEIDLIPLACGAVLLIVALAFSAGDRLRRDTVGLV